jgi:hypothetical protein
MRYIVLAQPYYEWIADQCRQVKAKYLPAHLEQESSAYADASWMSDLFTLIKTDPKTGLLHLRPESGGPVRKLPANCVVEYPN